MKLLENYKNSISYPFQSWKNLIILAILLFICSLFSLVSNAWIASILLFISIIIGWIANGYVVSIVENTINGSDSVPNFVWKSNALTGIRLFVINIIYGIIIIVISYIILFVTGGLDFFSTIFTTPQASFTNTLISSAQAATAQAYLVSNPLVIIGFILIAIIAIIAVFFVLISTCRLAKTHSLRKSLSFSGIVEDIKKIGVIELIVWYIVLVIICAIIGIIAGIILLIPIIGFIIDALIISPLLVMFVARSMGLLYANA